MIVNKENIAYQAAITPVAKRLNIVLHLIHQTIEHVQPIKIEVNSRFVINASSAEWYKGASIGEYKNSSDGALYHNGFTLLNKLVISITKDI